MKHLTLLLVILLTSCATIQTDRDRLEDEFNTYAQELRYERDVFRIALEECKGN